VKTREMDLNQVKDVQKEVAELRGSFSKVEVALTTFLKRTKDRSITGNEAEAHVKEDAALDDEGDEAEAEVEDDAHIEKANTFGMIHMEYLDHERNNIITDLFRKGFVRDSSRSVLLAFSQSYVEHDLRKNKIVIPFFLLTN
jgi:hypothetical protein